MSKVTCPNCGYSINFGDPNFPSVYSQRDPKWAGVPLGFSKNTTIGSDGCFVTSLAMMVHKEPDVVNQMLKDGNAFGGPNRNLIISDRAAKVLGLEYHGKETDINKTPKWSFNIKEVDMSPAPGKQQHFVVRFVEYGGGKAIVDPWDGKIKRIGFYPFISYRLFKRV